MICIFNPFCCVCVCWYGRVYLRPTHVLQGAANGACALANLQPLAEPEIDEFHVVIGVEQDVLGLQITIDNAGIMQKICEWIGEQYKNDITQHQYHNNGIHKTILTNHNLFYRNGNAKKNRNTFD